MHPTSFGKHTPFLPNIPEEVSPKVEPLAREKNPHERAPSAPISKTSAAAAFIRPHSVGIEEPFLCELSRRKLYTSLLTWAERTPSTPFDSKKNSPLHYVWNEPDALLSPVALQLMKYIDPRGRNREGQTPFALFCINHGEKFLHKENLESLLKGNARDPKLSFPCEHPLSRFWKILEQGYHIPMDWTLSYNLVELVYLLGNKSLERMLFTPMDKKTFYTLAGRLFERYPIESVNKFVKNFCCLEETRSPFSPTFELLQNSLARTEALSLTDDAHSAVDRTDKKGTPLICTAAHTGSLKDVVELLERGARPSSRCSSGNNILHYAALNPTCLNDFSLLDLMHYVDPRMKNEDDISAFYALCATKRLCKTEQFFSYIQKLLGDTSIDYEKLLPKEFWDILASNYVDKKILESCNIVEFCYLFAHSELETILFKSLEETTFLQACSRISERYPKESVLLFIKNFWLVKMQSSSPHEAVATCSSSLLQPPPTPLSQEKQFVPISRAVSASPREVRACSTLDLPPSRTESGAASSHERPRSMEPLHAEPTSPGTPDPSLQDPIEKRLSRLGQHLSSLSL